MVEKKLELKLCSMNLIIIILLTTTTTHESDFWAANLHSFVQLQAKVAAVVAVVGYILFLMRLFYSWHDEIAGSLLDVDLFAHI